MRFGAWVGMLSWGKSVSVCCDLWMRDVLMVMVIVDVFHQLHCLNSLRKLGYPE